MPHSCQIETMPDVFAYDGRILARCRCHSRAWESRKSDDPPFACPVTGETLPGGKL